MTKVHGLPACTCQKKWIPAFEAELKRRGFAIRWVQLIGGGKKSGGTHSTGGAGDFYLLSWPKKMTKAQAWRAVIAVCRQMGSDAAWFRPYNWDNKGGEEHGHQVLTDCPHNAPARYQIDDVRRGLNGLANHRPDTGPRPLSARTWREGIAWAKEQRPQPIRLVTWNVALILRHARLSAKYRTSKQTAYLKKWDIDALAAQECPSSGDGALLFPKLAKIGLDKRVGSKGRYVILRSAVTDVHDWKSVSFGDKAATLVAATIRGQKVVIANCHPRSGSDAATKLHRARWAEKVIDATLEFAAENDVAEADVIFAGDFNGSEFAAAAKARGWVRASTYARIKSALTRTYNAWGRKRTNPGGTYDYVLVHKSKKSLIAKVKTFFTPRASDHNPVFAEIKE